MIATQVLDSGDEEAPYLMLDSTAVVLVWTTGDPERVRSHFEKLPHWGSWVVPVILEARWHHRFAEWLKWQAWRWMFFRKLLEREKTAKKRATQAQVRMKQQAKNAGR